MPETVIASEAPLQLATTIGAEGIFKAAKAVGKKRDPRLDFLEAKHPSYLDNIELWMTMGSIALGSVSSDRDKKKLLVQGDAEDTRQFNKRIELSKFLPETPGLLSDFTGAVFSKPAQRKFQQPEENQKPAKSLRLSLDAERVKEFIDSAGLEFQPLTRVAEKATKLALVYGSVDAVLEHPIEEGTEIPQTVLNTPLQRLDWQEDDEGNFLWVKYFERRLVKNFWNGPTRIVDEYRIYTGPSAGNPGQIQVFQVMEDEIVDEFIIEHEFPSIPIRTLYWNKLSSGVGDPWVKPLIEADIKAFRQESDLTWDVFVHAHPWILAWLHKRGRDDNPLTRIRLGSDWALHLDPGGEERPKEDIRYEAPLVAELQFQMELSKETRSHVRKLASNGSDTQVQTGAMPESGVAIAYRNAQRAKNFIQMARALQEWEWQVLELVASEGMDELADVAGILEVKYPDRFDQRLTDELAADLESTEKIGSLVLQKEVAKKLAAKLVGDGASQELIEEINAEIDAIGPTPVAEGEEEITPEGEGAVVSEQGEGAENEGVVDVNELTLGVERLARVGDFEVANILRRTLAKKLGVTPPRDLTEADVVSFRREVTPVKGAGAAPAEM